MATADYRSNILGDVRAENDHQMLDAAFHEWQNYKSLTEADDRFVVVGRRGTGKSALTYRLMKDWQAKKHFVIVVSPAEEEFIGLRVIAEKFGSTVQRVRAAIKLGWRYALLMEIGTHLLSYYKTSDQLAASQLVPKIKDWEHSGSSIIPRLRAALRATLVADEPASESIAELSTRLRLEELTSVISGICENLNKRIVILIDRLDEGYEPDDIGIGIVDGIVYGTDDLRSRVPSLKAVLFLRDNIFRAIQISDQDFSRNIEGNVLRLHWDIQELFYLICKRLRTAFNQTIESDTKLWNHFTSLELNGQDGFRKCLQLTLFRPRDLVSLLNNAFSTARKQQREKLMLSDLEESAKYISEVRYDDLSKEYSSVFPGISILTKAFAGQASKLFVDDARAIIDSVVKRPSLDQQVLQHLILLGSADEILKALHAVGFLGFLDKTSGNYVFCHDGREPEKILSDVEAVLIHPCYWTALNIKSETLDANAAQEIYDEYEITIASQSKEVRDQKIGRIIAELHEIEMGNEDAHVFEDWCKRVIELIFAGQLTNVQTRPNSNAAARRDVVATNEGVKGFWQRILKDYQTRQVVFEVKNYEKLTVAEYRQAYSYLGKEYGSCAFLICRDKKKELSKGSELEAFREFYNKNAMILKLTSHFLVSILSKLRSPQKFDAASELLNKHLDEHIRLYSSGQTASSPSKKSRKK